MIMFKIIFTFLFFFTISLSLYADQNDNRLNYLFDKLAVAEEEKEINKILIKFGKFGMKLMILKQLGSLKLVFK